MIPGATGIMLSRDFLFPFLLCPACFLIHTVNHSSKPDKHNGIPTRRALASAGFTDVCVISRRRPSGSFGAKFGRALLHVDPSCVVCDGRWKEAQRRNRGNRGNTARWSLRTTPGSIPKIFVKSHTNHRNPGEKKNSLRMTLSPNTSCPVTTRPTTAREEGLPLQATTPSTYSP